MDEEYDVIVLGTGLTVSSQASFALRSNKKQNKKTINCANFHMIILARLWARYPPIYPSPEVKASCIPVRL